jgi:hypothetical protein
MKEFTIDPEGISLEGFKFVEEFDFDGELMQFYKNHESEIGICLTSSPP